MKLLLYLTTPLLIFPCFAQEAEFETTGINYASINQMEVETICRLLTHSTGTNVTATAEAQKKQCSFLFRNGTIEQTINSMCVSSGLVYRKDPIYQGYQILTLNEFRQNTVFSASEKIEVFKLEPANLRIIAKSIESLFPDEAIFDDPEGVLDFSSINTSGSGSGGNDNSDSDTDSNQNSRTVIGGGNNQRQDQSGRGTQLEVLDKKTIQQEKPQQLGTSLYITINEEHSQLIIRTANLAALKKIEGLIKETNRPLQQVLLEMKILELNVGDGEQLGVDWTGKKGKDVLRPSSRDNQGQVTEQSFAGYKHNFGLGNFATEAASTFVYSFLSKDINARIQALASNNDVEVVATPMLVAVNNREANIVVAEERVIVTGASVDRTIAGDNGTVNDQITTTTEVRNIGTSLKVIPRINGDQTVTLYVNQESSTVKVGGNRIPVGGTLVNVDSVEKATIDASIVAKNGKTIAIGGLIRTENAKTTDKVPLLGDIPIVGKAFRREKTSSRKTELILLITPYIIHGGQTDKTNDILNKSKHRYNKGGIEVLDRQNEGLREYENRTSDALLPRIGDLNRPTLSVNEPTPKYPAYHRHTEGGIAKPKSNQNGTKSSQPIDKRRMLNRR